MKRLISFSLYGENPKYTLNAIVNAMLAPSIYPGWTCRFHVDDTVPPGVVAALRSLPAVEVAMMDRHADARAMFWRFLPAAEPDLDAMISRDTDSWLSRREAVCVEEWLESGRRFHIVRDHCYHSFPMMGGLWGVRGGVLPDLPAWIDEFEGIFDQGFLAERIYPLTLGHSVVHRGEQHDRDGVPTDYHGDGAVPMPGYVEPNEPVGGVSFLEAQRLNDFPCAHCGRTHESYVGAMFNRIPSRTLEEIRVVLEQAGVMPGDVPGLVDALSPVSETEPSEAEPDPDVEETVEQEADETAGSGEGVGHGYEDDGFEDVEDREETILWLEAQLEQEVADGERRAEELRQRSRRVHELETQLAGYLSPFRAFPGGCGVDLVVFSSSGSVPAVAADYAENGHRVFLLDRRDGSTAPTARARELAPSLYRVTLPLAGADETAVDPQLAALDEFCRRAAIGRAIAFVDDPGWAELAMAAQSRLAWKLVYGPGDRSGDGGERLLANCDVVLPADSAGATSQREAIEQRLRAWYPRVAIVVVSFDNPEYLDLCLESLFAHSLYPNFEVIVVDNASSQATRSLLERHARESSQLRAVPTGGNLGFARACNLGIGAAPDADYVVLMNDDTVATRGWLGGLIRHLADERIGEVGPVTNYAGNAARIDAPYSALEEMHAFAARNAAARAGELADLPMLAMFCVALRASLIAKLGPLDERFSIGMYEDDDYAMRVRAAGYRIVCARDVFVHHWGGASFRRLDEATHARIHETHSRTFAETWGRESAGVERAPAPRVEASPRDAILDRFAEELTSRYAAGPVAVVREQAIASGHEWGPATLLTGADEGELRRRVEEGGAAVAFTGLLDGEPVVVATPEPFSFAPPPGFTVTAFVPVFNEADVLRACVEHHLAHGVDVHLIDNWSTDGSWELARELASGPGVTVERFPAGGPSGTYEWASLLGRIEVLAATGAHDWAVLADADEARVPPWPNRTLREALWAVDRHGFTAVDHTVLVFPPTDETFVPGSDPQQHFSHAEFWTGPGHSPQIKAWKRAPWPARLVPTGGHEAEFEGRRVFPFNFLDKHYPIRSQEHGERKVLGERIPRWAAEERARGWHAQYDDAAPGRSFTRSTAGLKRFEPEQFLRDHLVECLARIGIGEPDRLAATRR